MIDESEPTPFHVIDLMATAKNITTNGRLFCSMLFLANLVAGQHKVAILAAIPVGLSCVVDQLPAGPLRLYGSIGTYAIAAAVAFVSLLTLG